MYVVYKDEPILPTIQQLKCEAEMQRRPIRKLVFNSEEFEQLKKELRVGLMVPNKSIPINKILGIPFEVVDSWWP